MKLYIHHVRCESKRFLHAIKLHGSLSLQILLFSLGPLQGFTQQNREEVILQQIINSEVSLLLPNQLGINSVFIKQAGIENQAMVQQQSGTNAWILQEGVYNVIFLNQSGYNQLNVVQTGNQNLYRGLVSGDGIEGLILQQGDQNSIHQLTVGRELIFNILQEGSHNGVQLNVEGQSTSPLRIDQRGSDMQIIIYTKN